MSFQQPNTEDQDPSRESALPIRIQRGVETLLNERAAVALFLEERKKELAAGQYSELYEALQDWSQSRPELFEVLTLLMIGNEQFADDVEADFKKETLRNVAEIQDQFIQLRPAILKIQREQTHGLYNSYLMPELQNVNPGDADGIPVMQIGLMSGEETLVECRVSPSTALECGARLIAQTAGVLDQRSCDWGELAAVERHELNKVLNELPGLFDRLPEGEPTDVEFPKEGSGAQGPPQSYADRLVDTEDESRSYIH